MAFDWDDPSEFFDDDWADDAYYNGMAYKAIPYDKAFSTSVINAGLSESVSLSLMFKVADFETLPKPDEIITYNETEYRIMPNGVKVDSTNKTFTVDLVEKYG